MLTHTESPLSFSDQPGYVLVCLSSQKFGIELALDVQVTECIGWWQPGWLASLFRTPPTRERSFVGMFVWCENGERVPFNLEWALIRLRRKIEREQAE